MRDITLLSGGIGGAHFLRGLLRGIADSTITGLSTETRVTVVANTADDLWAHGLKVCPDLDHIMYATATADTSPGGDETRTVTAELSTYGVEPRWFEASDREFATHLVRTQMLEAGYRLSEVTEALCRRWRPGVTLLPMTDDRVETHVAVPDPSAPSGQRVVRRQEYAHTLLTQVVPAKVAHVIGLDKASAAPGVLEAVAHADLVVLSGDDPVASLGPILALPGMRESLGATSAKIVGLSPVVAGVPLDATTAALLGAAGLEADAAAVARHHGARRTGGLLDAWLVDHADAAAVPGLEVAGFDSLAVDLCSTSEHAANEVAAAAVAMAARR